MWYILLIIFVIWYMSRSTFTMPGVWEASRDFCNEAGIDNFIMFISKDQSGGKYGGYICSAVGDDFLINSPCGLSFTCVERADECQKYRVVFDDLEHDVEDFAAEQTIEYYPLTNKIIMYTDDGVVTAILYKNSIETAKAFAAGSQSETDEFVEEFDAPLDSDSEAND